MSLESVFRFGGYRICQIRFMENTKFSSQEKGIKIDIKFKVITVLKDKGRVLLTIKVELFKNSEVNNYPFELSFFLVGEFDTDETDEKKIEEFLVEQLFIELSFFFRIRIPNCQYIIWIETMNGFIAHYGHIFKQMGN